jgi:hypothetical protein
VVNEYGELLEGLVTLEDIIEELVGKFTTGQPGSTISLTWVDGSVIVDGGRSLRELNGKLGLNLPLNGPKTLNGLLLDHLQDIPESAAGRWRGHGDRANTGPKDQDGAASPPRRRVILSAYSWRRMPRAEFQWRLAPVFWR